MDDPDFHTTAMREACWSRNAQVLKRLRLDPARDDPTELLRDSGAHTSGEVVSVLLELGASPNDKPDGGSTVLDSLIARLDWEDVNARLWGGVNYRATLEKTSKTRTAIRQMVELRALWKPDRRAMNDARRALYGTVPEVIFELVHLFTTHGACDDKTLQDLLRTPRMQEHLAPVREQLARIGIARNGRRCPIPERVIAPFSYVLVRYNRERLYEEVWAEPTGAVAGPYTVSPTCPCKAGTWSRLQERADAIVGAMAHCWTRWWPSGVKVSSE
jgi:hypothetical protein